MADDRIKLLWMSDSIHVPTGYGRVTKEVLTRLDKKKFDVNHFGWQTVGQPHEIYGIMTYPVGNNKWGEDILRYHLSVVKPDFFIQLCDMWMANYTLDMDFSPAKYLMYFPLDGHPIPYGCDRNLMKADVAIAMSKWGKKVVDEALFKDQSLGKSVKLSDRLPHPVEYIPHGVSTDVFYPLKESEKADLRKQEKLEDKFVVGMVSRNQPRKMLPRLLKAFKKFKEGKRDVILYMHCDPKDPQGYNLLGTADVLGYDPSDIRYTKMHSFKYGVEDNVLNQVYNLMDVHTIPTSGEGFGLTILEAISAGIPNILTDCTTTDELVGSKNERGIKVPVIDSLTGSMIVERAIIDVDKYADALQYAYDNRDEMRKRGKKGREFALGYDWDLIAKQWEDLLVRESQ